MDNLSFGLGITVVGMGIVFGVLILLWLLLTLALRLETRGVRLAAADATGGATGGAADEPAAATGDDTTAATGGPPDERATTVRLVGAPGDLDPALAAAITVAVLRHTEALRLQAAPSMRSYWPGSLLFASRWVAAGRTRQGQSWRRRR